MDKINQMREKIGRISDYAFLGVILAVCLLYRVFYFGYLNPGVVLYNSDSVSYFFPVDVFRGVIDLYRTPLYAYVIKFFEYVSKDHLVSNLILFQQVISFASLIPFYFVSRIVIKNRLLVMIATLFYGCWHPILIQNIHLNPESLCFAGSVLLLYLLVRYLDNPQRLTALSLGIAPFFLIMLKPTYLILLGVVFLFLIFRMVLHREERIRLCWGLFGLFFSVIGVLGYCEMNQRQNGQFVLSNIALNNTLAHITTSRAYQYGGDEEFIAIIDASPKQTYYDVPFTINNDFIDRYLLYSQRFPQYLIPTEDMLYCLTIPDRENFAPERIKQFVKNSTRSTVYVKYMLKRAFDIVIAAYGYLFLLFFLQSVIILCLFIKYKKVLWVQGFCMLFVLGQFFSIWLVGLDDMDRHLMPSYPFIIQIAGSFSVILISFFKKGKIIEIIF
jgi:hypothetical protein